MDNIREETCSKDPSPQNVTMERDLFIIFEIYCRIECPEIFPVFLMSIFTLSPEEELLYIFQK